MLLSFGCLGRRCVGCCVGGGMSVGIRGSCEIHLVFVECSFLLSYLFHLEGIHLWRSGGL